MQVNRPVFAERTLHLVDESLGQTNEVLVTVYSPEPLQGGGGYRCVYQIDGLGERTPKEGKGTDALQALVHAMAKIGIDLYKSPEAQAGLLRWCGDRNLGFPVFEAMTSFVPDPKEILVM